MATTRTVGAYEAKTILPELLRFASEGNEVVITRHGRPLAKLTSAEPGAGAGSLFDEIDALAKEIPRRRAQSNRDLIQAGRRI